MFDFGQLRIPVLVAPMFGGPSTPALVAAVTNAGGSGFLAAGGGIPTGDLAALVAETRSLTDGPFGVNLFVPSPEPPDREAVEGYRIALQPEAARYGVEVPGFADETPSYWQEDLDWLARHPVALVSFTFGCPPADEIARLRGAGATVLVTVTNEAEAREAVSRGADALCVQGPEAGGHRSTHGVFDEPDRRDLLSLLRAVRAVVEVPLVAAGGIARPEQVQSALGAGAAAVQAGTLFLRSPESGASPTYKAALASGAYTETRPTRAFSGRLARGLVNRLMEAHHDEAAAAYPAVNRLTGPLRRPAGAGDADGLSLWAGTSFRETPDAPAAEIVRLLWRDGVG